MTRPRLLELHCCQGAAYTGYDRAGFDVTGVDIAPRHARYYPGTLVVADAVEYVKAHGHEYDAIHASPPCQWYTRGNAPRRGQPSKWPRSIPPVREALEATGNPYVIENVRDAAWELREPVTLCGCQFSLTTTDTDGTTLHLRRPRLFEATFPLAPPRPCHHPKGQQIAGVYGGARRDKHEARHVRRGGYVPPDKTTAAALLGITHPMTWEGLYEAVPPAYTHHVGLALLAHLGQP